ncbi:MAG: hypothetical protein BIP78_0594 [Candidatus Bipolaricaulis sibiricus]|uniref:DUF86 domain-containing protein n=1 Tax=Bipolaricaulis sibiricus TaxID=2501609 RepID=A0A410FTV6_BIPS1|nr:MAG: hypothetical protein BIP78_0594 [Candidatus Bipolaricaulis sibiricus]
MIERLTKLDGVVAKLAQRADMTRDAYRADTDAQWIIERGLEIGSSIVLDIGNHILAGAFQISVDEYEQIIERLREKDVISAGLHAELRGLGGFRNVLVHAYAKLDPELVYEHYRKALRTFPRFIGEIERWLSSRAA